MKIFVKTLKGTHFEIDVNPEDTVTDVKKNIESSQGQNVYPADKQMLIYQGKILKDTTTLAENNVSENTFVVIMLSKPKTTTIDAPSATTSATSRQVPSAIPAAITPSVPAPSAAPAPAASPAPTPVVPTQPVVATTQATPAVQTSTETASMEADTYGLAASNLVAGNNFEQAIQQILDMGGGAWDRDTVVRALRAAFNNPERAVEYLYSGIPEQPENPPVAQIPPTEGVNPPPPSQTAAAPTTGPNANPLDLFPQGLPSLGSAAGGNNLDFLRNSSQFRALQAMVQANPHILQPMLQELGKQNPQLMRLIQEHQADFIRLLNEPAAEGGESGNLSGQLPSAVPQAVQVTPEEREAIERLEAMGFNRAVVLQVYFACNKNEELAANYLLDHMHEFEE